MSCPHKHNLRAGLPPMTKRIEALPIDERGYPIPFFVAMVDGKPEFRAADAHKKALCLKYRLCWVCGQSLGRYKAFGIGPMCAITRTTAEPPNHLECLLWSVKACPFLSRPAMVRREDDFTRENKDSAPGIMIDRNPGITCAWTTKLFKPFSDGRQGVLFEVGDPDHVSWWREGRAATRSEVLESIETGLPFLQAHCDDERDLKDLAGQVAKMMRYLPEV